MVARVVPTASEKTGSSSRNSAHPARARLLHPPSSASPATAAAPITFRRSTGKHRHAPPHPSLHRQALLRPAPSSRSTVRAARPPSSPAGSTARRPGLGIGAPRGIYRRAPPPDRPISRHLSCPSPRRTRTPDLFRKILPWRFSLPYFPRSPAPLLASPTSQAHWGLQILVPLLGRGEGRTCVCGAGRMGFLHSVLPAMRLLHHLYRARSAPSLLHLQHLVLN
jgi:hypothetical protein